jgi:hypothetical protein
LLYLSDISEEGETDYHQTWDLNFNMRVK